MLRGIQEPGNVFQDLGVVPPCGVSVPCRIQDLDVGEDPVKVGGTGLHQGRVGEETRFNRGVKSLGFASLQDILQEVSLEKRLATGERHAAAALKEYRIFPDLFHQGVQVIGRAVVADRRRRTGIDDFIEMPGVLMVQHRCPVFPFQLTWSGSGFAAAAVNALVFQIHRLSGSPEPFGVLAPFAAKGTAFEEHRRADPVSVMHGKPLDVKHQSLPVRLQVMPFSFSLNLAGVCHLPFSCIHERFPPLCLRPHPI